MKMREENQIRKTRAQKNAQVGTYPQTSLLFMDSKRLFTFVLTFDLKNDAPKGILSRHRLKMRRILQRRDIKRHKGT